MRPGPTLERVWFAYLAAVVAVAVLTPGHGHHGHRLDLHLATHAVLFAAVVGVHRLAVRRGADAARPWRIALAIGGLPVVFSAMGWLLPAVHPEPFEFACLAFDRALCGADVARLCDPWLQPWLVEAMQLVYAAFYGIPIAAALLVWRGAGTAAFDRAMLTLVAGFQASYLGYLLVPTLGPNRVLPHPQEVQGLWLTAPVRQSIDAAEANWWDCFPSGHTMLTLVSLLLLWRWHRRGFWCLLGPGLLLIASTLALRYHWTIDVLAGALLAWPALWLADRLADRDGWPAVVRPA